MSIKVITACTDKKFYFPYLEKTCKENDADFVVLGLGEKWGGYIWKFNKMIDYLKTLEPNEIVCFVDGYDVICIKNLKDVKEKFLHFSKIHKSKIIIGKDNNSLFPEIIRKYYFGKIPINSGTYIGKSGDILNVLEKSRILFPDVIDDQILIIKYAESFPNEIFVDENFDFFYVYMFPFTESDVKGNPYFVHAPGCSLLNNILSLEESEKNRINNDLKHLMIKKASYHGYEIIKKSMKIILILVLIILLIIYLRNRK
jgi:hypothetical protein